MQFIASRHTNILVFSANEKHTDSLHSAWECSKLQKLMHSSKE